MIRTFCKAFFFLVAASLTVADMRENPTSQAYAQSFLSSNGTFVPVAAAQAFTAPSGTFSDFVHDDAPAINAALAVASANGGGWVLLNEQLPYWAQTQITVPANVTLGCAAPPVFQPAGNNPDFTRLGCSVYLAPNNPLNVSGALINARVLQDNVHFAGNPTTAHGMALITTGYATTGTGVVLNGFDSLVRDVAAAGFNLCILDDSVNRGTIQRVRLDCANGAKSTAVGDYLKWYDLEAFPYYSGGQRPNISSYTTTISNVANNGSGFWRVTLGAPPVEAFQANDPIYVGGTGAIAVPLGALGPATITNVVDSTHIDINLPVAPSYTGTTTSGSANVTGLSSILGLYAGETFTGSCFSGTRTVKHVAQVSQVLVADAAATSSGSCTLTFASPAFASGGTPQVIYVAYGGQHGIGYEFAATAGVIGHNLYAWCHDVGLQFDASVGVNNIDAVSVDCFPSQFVKTRIGVNLLAGSAQNYVRGNSFTSGGTAIVNQNAQASLSLANTMQIGRVSSWTNGSVENVTGSVVLSSVLDPDNSSILQQFNGDLFNASGQNLVLANGSQFPNATLFTTGGNISGVFIDSSSEVGTAGSFYPAALTLGKTGSVSGQVNLFGATSGSSLVQAAPTGGLIFANNTAGQAILFNDAGNGTMFSVQSGFFLGKLFTVATLPTCTSGLNGARAFVTDNATAPAFNATVTGGGSGTPATNNMPVHCDGAAWLQG